MMNSKRDEELVFLTLGDGDFTWSLDLGRFLASSEDFCQRKRRLIASGIDTLEELSNKYRNSSFILREMKRLQETSDESFTVEVKHELNAIVSPGRELSCLPRAQVVIFNHPHLGTEDAALHSQFICHMFYSVAQVWLYQSGVFYLTLVKGQFERWECEKAATSNGMVLLGRHAFLATPSAISNPMYEHRRHQTGKSFASRTTGSETYMFIHSADQTTTSSDRMGLPKLPWFSAEIDAAVNDQKESTHFICSYCSKQFREQRSLMNHTKSKHGTDSQGKKRKLSADNDEERLHFACNRCDSTSAGLRTFLSSEALQDHIRAKHDALHAKIPPDSYQIPAQEVAEHLDFGSCSICFHVYRNRLSEKDHMAAFVPSEDVLLRASADDVAYLQCRFCSKTFRQARAQLQHENFCSSRPAGDQRAK